MRIGRRADGGTQLDGSVEFVAIFNQQLTVDEYLRIYGNPYYELYAPDPRRIYIGGGATGGATTWTYAPSGGIAIAGAAPLLKGKVYTPSGGVALAGAATTVGVTHAYTYSPSGGLSVAGAAALLKGKVYAASGGATIAGTAPVLKGKIYTPSGGVALSGAATTAYSAAGSTSYPYAATGGVTLAGTAPSTATKFYVAPVSGGIIVSGTATTSFTSTAATDYEYLPGGGLEFGGGALFEGPATGGGKPIRRRKRYLIRDRVYDDLDPSDVVAAAKQAGVDLGDVREVTKQPTAQKSKPRHADDDGREYWLPQEFWGRAAAQQRAQATSPLAADFYRAVEALRAPQGPLQQQMALRRRQEEEAILLLTS